jgi:hypothetical protein
MYLEFLVENLILFTTEIELKTTRNSGGKLRVDRSTTTRKIQGELRRFKRRRFDM